MKKNNLKNMLIASLFVVLLSMSGCGSATNNQGNPSASEPSVQQSSAPSSESGLKTFTKEELKKYNGKNGNPAYIAIEGKVYDVTNAPRWNNGMHEGVEAGNDLTEQMKNSPHGLSKLESVKVVGVLK